MAAPPPKRLCQTITCHTWSPDGSRLAICPNDNTIQIYARSGNDFTLETTLKEHDHLVTGLDWAPQSNRLLSCSQDRNAYVWTNDGGTWKPTLVILRINRAATWCKWSPNENKFAVSCGQKLVSICYFEEDNDWWVSKHIKKHRSTVTKVDWHPSNSLIATASTDCKARIFSAHIKGVDKGRPETPFGGKLPFGECLAEIDGSTGWVQSVKWSPSGNYLAFCGQDSTLSFGDISSGQVSVQTIKLQGLPFRDLLFVADEKLVAVGHDRIPKLYEWKGSEWAFSRAIDEAKGSGPAAAKSNASAARNMFQSKVDRGTNQTASTTLNSKHQNAIGTIAVLSRGGAGVAEYSTTGVDGNICIWKA
jgi:actin related protein 2/3 complex subunit 1A/1B